MLSCIMKEKPSMFVFVCVCLLLFAFVSLILFSGSVVKNGSTTGLLKFRSNGALPCCLEHVLWKVF